MLALLDDILELCLLLLERVLTLEELLEERDGDVTTATAAAGSVEIAASKLETTPTLATTSDSTVSGVKTTSENDEGKEDEEDDENEDGKAGRCWTSAARGRASGEEEEREESGGLF